MRSLLLLAITALSFNCSAQIDTGRLKVWTQAPKLLEQRQPGIRLSGPPSAIKFYTSQYKAPTCTVGKRINHGDTTMVIEFVSDTNTFTIFYRGVVDSVHSNKHRYTNLFIR